jgi:glucokinase
VTRGGHRADEQESRVRTLGVDLGGTNLYAVVLDDDETVGHAKRKTPVDGDRKDVVKAIVKAAGDALDDSELEVTEVVALGIGTPGVVVDGTIGDSPNVTGFRERFDLAGTLSEKLEIPVRVANDVTAAAVGEHLLGGGRGAEDLLCVFAGTGVGGGLILGGEPFEGRHGGAGEFGHMIVRQGGAVCTCGRRGCVEAYAGRRAMQLTAERAAAAGRDTVLFEVMEEKKRSQATSGVFATALAKGDGFVADLIEDAAAAIAAGIASTVNLLDIERVVLGGGLADKLGEPFRRKVEAVLAPLLFLSPTQVELVPAALGDEGGAVGAAILARETA